VQNAPFARCFDLEEEAMTGKHDEQNDTRTARKRYISVNHNETLVRSGRLINHNETLVRDVLSVNHSETLVLDDLDLPEAEAEHVKGGALGDIKGEAQDEKHAAQIEVMSWEWGLK
jgi:hypothetical protein